MFHLCTSIMLDCFDSIVLRSGNSSLENLIISLTFYYWKAYLIIKIFNFRIISIKHGLASYQSLRFCSDTTGPFF